MQTSFHFPMTMTMRSRAHTGAALAEEAGAVNDLHLSAAQQALSNRRQPLASVSQFRSFTARNPTASVTPHRDAASQSLRGSADLGHHESVSGDQFPYCHDSTPEHHEPSRFQWFSPEDGPGDDPDDPGDDNNNDDDDDEFLDTTEELDPSLAVFHNLAIAVNRLSHSSCHTNNSSSSRAKVREPDTFDGTDPKKLRTFLVQCELCFQDRAKAFCQDRARVMFAQSYLKGMTLEWFELDLLNSGNLADHPRWMDSWVHFVAELQSTFGPHDPVADAEHQLEHLQMKDSYWVTRYIVDFNCLASQVQDYGDGALHRLFYSGLLDRLKDEIARVRKPLTLNGLRALCQEIDTRYWECKDKISRTTKSQSTSSTTKPSNSRGNTPKSSQAKTGNSPSSANTSGSSKATSNQSSSGSKPDLTNKLGKDGKLTADECKWRLENNLCMFCGGTGHFVDNCPKKSKKAKAHAAAVAAESGKMDSTNSGPNSKSKKRVSSSQPSAQPASCIDSGSAPKEACLNVSTLYNPNSLMPHVILLSFDSPKTCALVDSGSTHCFVDIKFAHKNNITTYSVPPITLWLFDGTSNFVLTQAVDISVKFPTSGDVTPMTFYLAPLDSECSIVLGHNWLTCYNPLIDWVLSSLTFRTPAGSLLAPLSTPSPVQSSNPDSGPSGQSTPGPAPSVDTPVCTPPHISLINAATFVHACKLEGSTKYQLQLCPSDSAKAHSSSASTPPDLDIVPLEYRNYADVFSKVKASELPPHCDYDLKIDLEEGTSPPLGTLYSLSPVELSALQTFIDENLNTGFIRPTTSSHAAPVLFVKKKDGSLRLCVDFRGLNKITKKDHYPLPLISDLLDSPSRAKIYSKIDLRHAYHLVWIAPGNEWKTAFRTRYGSYKWLVMPFGLTNAPAAFQCFVNTIFADMLDVCIVIYLDDILIYSEDMESHQQHVREVLCRLWLHGLFAKPEKCEFHSDSVEYLGYCLSPEGLTMAPDKIQTISNWPEPRKVKDIQSFLGFANFYHRFIFNYLDIVVPLTQLTRKDAPWNFSEDC